jgi:PAS domain S-box-containing protein
LCLALGLVGAAVAVRFAMGPGYPAPFIPFYPAILASTLLGGRPAGYAALVASMTSAAYLFFALPGSMPPTAVPVAVALFGLVALTVIEILVGLTSLADRLRDRERFLLQQAQALAQREVQTAARLGELEAIYEQAPIGLGFLDADLRFVRINSALAEINGHSVEAHLGQCVWDLVPDLRANAEPLLRGVLEQGTIARDVELSGETPALPGVERHWKELFYPVLGADGRPDGVGILCEETTDVKRAQEREDLLMHEVDHRAKNLLAVVQSVVQLTRFTGDPDAFKASITGRIQALGRVHALLSRNRWEGVRLDEIVQQELAPFEGAVGLAMLDHPLHLSPGAAQAISMVLHELFTNSVKYGALSANGRVELAFSESGDGESVIGLDWREHDGPPVTVPQAAGFGTKLIRTAVKGTLGGELDYQLKPEGLHCTIRFPRSACAAA